MFKNKKVLVTGGTGMVGIPLVKKLLERGAKVTVASLDKEPRRKVEGAKYFCYDLTDKTLCEKLCENKDFVFHLAGVKGSPKMCAEKPATFMVPLLQMNTNMMEAARVKKVKRYLYTSSIGVYYPSSILEEDDMWKRPPSENDRFAGWAKRMGELQATAYNIQYRKSNFLISVVRPANIYGPFDNFDPENAMVIPSLIARAKNEAGPLIVWGDGTPIRDFIYSEDVADGMIKILESGSPVPINLGSGIGHSIANISSLIAKRLNKTITFDTTKPMGDPIRTLNTERARALNFIPKTTIEKGIEETVKWYLANDDVKRYNVFTEKR